MSSAGIANSAENLISLELSRQLTAMSGTLPEAVSARVGPQGGGGMAVWRYGGGGDEDGGGGGTGSERFRGSAEGPWPKR